MSDLKQQIKVLESKENKEMQTKIIALEKTLKNTKTLLKSHIYSSQIFDWLEKLTLGQVQWTSFDLKAKTGQLSLKGQTANYNTLAKQILIFENDPEVKNIKTSGIALSQLGGVGFSMEIVLEPKIFSK